MVESDRFQAKCGQNVALKGNFFWRNEIFELTTKKGKWSSEYFA